MEKNSAVTNTTQPNVWESVGYWLWHMSFTLFVFGLLYRVQFPLFLGSFFAHSALIYVISKNATNVIESRWGLRRHRYQWQHPKKRLLVTCISIVNESFVLIWRYQEQPNHNTYDLLVLGLVLILGVILHSRDVQ